MVCVSRPRGVQRQKMRLCKFYIVFHTTDITPFDSSLSSKLNAGPIYANLTYRCLPARCRGERCARKHNIPHDR